MRPPADVGMNGAGAALVTGASSGIGRAFAIQLAERRWSVILVARDGERLRKLAETLPGGPHELLAADLATVEGCADVAERLGRDDAPVDLLVNAAGLGTTDVFPHVSLEQEETQLAVNVRAVLRLSWAAARAMRGRGRGGIVNIASTAAVWSDGTYAASKAWVVAATEGLAMSLRDVPVRVLCVIPGFTRTEFHDRSSVDSTGVQPWLWLTPQQVARESLAALDQGRSTCVPGRQYRVLVRLVRLLPAGGRHAVLCRLAPLAPRSEEP